MEDKTERGDMTILHVDMDAFFASVEERDNPAIRGKAVVVGAGMRGVVSAANYEARKYGIRSAMPIARAKRMAPHAIFIPPRHHRYSEVSDHVMSILGDFTPLVEPLSIDEAFLDVTGARRLLGSGFEIGQAIRARVQNEIGITCSVGIASSKFVAKLASSNCKPNGILEIDPEKVLDFLHPLAVSELWGVGPKTAEVLERLGLRTVGDIAQTPRSTLVRALGEASGEHLHELSWGRDFRQVVVDEPERSISNEETFSYDIDDPDEIMKEFLRLTERATSRLRERELFAKTVGIKVRFADFSTITRSKTLPLPIDSTHDAYETVKLLYKGLKLDRVRLRLIGVSLENLADDAPEQMVIGQRERGWREAEGAIDKARERFGRRSVRPGRLTDAQDRTESSGPEQDK